MGYEYWQQALHITDGKRPLTREEMTGLRISEDEIGLGFFRMRSVPREPWSTAVAIWDTGQNIAASVDGWLIASPASHIWLSACKFPIHEDMYRARIEGKKWPVDGEAE